MSPRLFRPLALAALLAVAWACLLAASASAFDVGVSFQSDRDTLARGAVLTKIVDYHTVETSAPNSEGLLKNTYAYYILSSIKYAINTYQSFGETVSADANPQRFDVVNTSEHTHADHGALIWLGGAFAVVQMAIILFLAVNTAKRRQAQKDLRLAQRELEARVRERTSEVKETIQALRTVFDSSQDAIIVHTVSGRILDVNDRMLNVFGVERDELSKLSISRDLSSRDNAVYRLSAIWRAALNGQPQRFEWRARRPLDGQEFETEMNLSRIVFRGEEAILANVRDITVRKESENRIRQSLSKFEAILDNSLMGIAMSRGRKLAAINRRGAEIFGHTPGELIGESIAGLLGSPEAEDAFVAASRDALTLTGEFNTDQAFRNRDGKAVWCRMYAKAVDPDSLDKGVIWAWDDVTEQRRAQEEIMRAREDAESANRAKSEFLAAMSHEIRTPMNAIVGMTDITLQTDLTDAQRDCLRTVMDSSRHLLNIINDILDLSKIEARKLTLDRVDFDLDYHVNTTIKGLSHQAQQKGLELGLDVDEELTPCVKGDPLSLRQVLMNLVGNAIKFTRQGSVRVSVRPAPPDASRNPADPRTEGIAFDVADTGIGIPEEFLDTIFQSFAQTTRAFGGTGLGLAICKELIALMGGEITVKSRVGEGSVFTFTAWFEPGAACPLPREETSPRPEPLDRPVHVLVAEDNEVNVMVTAMRLEERGYTYAVASNGLEALDALKRERFDIVLMDIEMPVLDGISATKAIRSSPPGGAVLDPSIPIVGVTAHALKEFREKSLAAGMNDYVSKPVDFVELNAIVNRLVGGGPADAQIERESPPEPKTPQRAAEPWTLEAARSRLDVDEPIFQGFLNTAETELRSHLAELASAMPADDAPMRAEDVEMTTQAARTVSAICRTLSATQAARTADELAEALSLGERARERFDALTAELERLLPKMAA